MISSSSAFDSSMPGHVLEGHPLLVLGEQPGLRLAEAHGLAAARLHLADEEDPQPDEEQQREPHDQDLAPEAALVLGLGVDLAPRSSVRSKVEELLGDDRRVGGELAAVVELALDVSPLRW